MGEIQRAHLAGLHETAEDQQQALFVRELTEDVRYRACMQLEISGSFDRWTMGQSVFISLSNLVIAYLEKV